MAVNQAAGRVVRHYKDHGAVLLLDVRYKENNATQNISPWLKPHIVTFESPSKAATSLTQFFTSNASVNSQVCYSTNLLSRSRDIQSQDHVNAGPSATDYLKSTSTPTGSSINDISRPKRKRIKIISNCSTASSQCEEEHIEIRPGMQ